MNVELVSKTEVNREYFVDKYYDDLHMMNNYGDDMPEITPEQLIIYIARVSSSRTDKEKLEGHEKLINYLIDHKHWSPFEHAYMTVEIETSRAISHQLIRHRSFTFQEFSQRYAEVTEFEDVELRKQPKNNRQSSGEVINPEILSPWYEDQNRSNDEVQGIVNTVNIIYDRLLKAGVARETARMILPLCTQTTFYMTGNIRSWIHFLGIRDDKHAQKEIVEVAQEIGKIFQQQYPVISKALEFDYETK